jgi:hypothetical protein
MGNRDTAPGAGLGRAARSRSAVAFAALVALLAGCPGAPRGASPREIALPPGGIGIRADGVTMSMLPIDGVEDLELEYRASGHLHLTWGTAETPEDMRSIAVPWRHAVVAPGTGSLRLDLRTTPAWSPARHPYLRVAGTGELVITRLRAVPVTRNGARLVDDQDAAWRWAPVSVDHSTVNLLDPPYWKVSTPSLLFHRLGWLFLALTAAGCAGMALWRRSFRPGPVVALAALSTMALGNGVAWARLLPVLDLRLPSGREERIRDGYRLDAEIGPLAALARAHLRPDDRVGILVAPGAWYPWEALCFNLAPRRCVHLEPGAAESMGLQGVDRLRLEDLDAVVTFHPVDPIPPGFVPVASLNPNATVARRP